MYQIRIIVLSFLWISTSFMGCGSTELDRYHYELEKSKELGERSSIRYFKLHFAAHPDVRTDRTYIGYPDMQDSLFVETLDTNWSTHGTFKTVMGKIYQRKNGQEKLVFVFEESIKRLDLKRSIRLRHVKDSFFNRKPAFFIDTIASVWLQKRNEVILDSILIEMEEGSEICGTAANEILNSEFLEENTQNLDSLTYNLLRKEWQKSDSNRYQ